MKAVLFDLDGTLLDTLADIATSCNAALTRHGFPAHPVEAYRHFVGDGVQLLIQRTVPPGTTDPATLAAVSATYREEYHRRWNATTCIYPGVDTLLDELAARRVAMAVLSNKPHDFTAECVSQFLSRWRFEMVLGATDKFPTKPDPASARHVARTLGVPPGEFLYVGDTGTDMRTARAAGMCAVGALWGFRAADELLGAGAHHLIPDPLALLPLLNGR